MEYLAHIDNWPVWLLGIAIAVIGFFLRKESTRSERKEQQLEDDAKFLSDELNKFKLEAQEKYVNKDEFVRALSGVERSIERMRDHLDKKLDTVMGQIIQNSIKIAEKERGSDE